MANEPDVLMLFDGECNFCSRSAGFIARRTDETLKFCAMQSQAGQAHLREIGMPTSDFETFAVIDGETILARSDAVLRIGRSMGPSWRVLARFAAFVPRAWRDRLYDFVARHRYRIMGRRNACRPSDPSIRHRFLS